MTLIRNHPPRAPVKRRRAITEQSPEQKISASVIMLSDKLARMSAGYNDCNSKLLIALRAWQFRYEDDSGSESDDE